MTRIPTSQFTNSQFAIRNRNSQVGQTALGSRNSQWQDSQVSIRNSQLRKSLLASRNRAELVLGQLPNIALSYLLVISVLAAH